MAHVFISYVRENSGVVDRLARALSDNGITVWLDRKNIFPGMLWKDAITRAIREGAFFIACFSAEAERQERTYMREEIILAIDELRLRSLNKSWFIPVLINDTNVPSVRISNAYDLTDIHFLKLYEDWDSSIQLLVQVINSDGQIRAEQDRMSWTRMIQLTTDPLGERLRAIQAISNTTNPTQEALKALTQACRDDNILIKKRLIPLTQVPLYVVCEAGRA
jgi:TIR domain